MDHVLQLFPGLLALLAALGLHAGDLLGALFHGFLSTALLDPPPPGGGGASGTISSVLCQAKGLLVLGGAIIGSLSILGACALASASFWAPSFWQQKKSTLPTVIFGLVGLACFSIIMTFIFGLATQVGGSSIATCA